MTRYAAPHRALRSRKTAAVLICLLLLGSVFAIIHAGTGNTTNITGVGFGIEATGPLSHQASQSQNQPQATIATSCTNGTYTSAYGDIVCTPEPASTAPARVTTPCTNGIRTSPYGDIICRPTAKHTTTTPVCQPGTAC